MNRSAAALFAVLPLIACAPMERASEPPAAFRYTPQTLRSEPATFPTYDDELPPDDDVLIERRPRLGTQLPRVLERTVDPPPPVPEVENPPVTDPGYAVGQLNQQGNHITGTLGGDPVLLNEQGNITTGTIGSEPVILNRHGNVTTGRVGNENVILNDTGRGSTGRIGDRLIIIREP